MKRGSTIFLQVVVVLIGLATVALLLWEPHVEGVNQNATLWQMYSDPFIAYVYLTFVPFFVVLYQAFKVLGYAGRNEVFSLAAVKALRTMKYCAIAMIGFVAVSFVFMTVGDPEDRPAGIFMRLLIGFPAIVVAAAAAMFQRILQNAVDLKTEHDLTV